MHACCLLPASFAEQSFICGLSGESPKMARIKDVVFTSPTMSITCVVEQFLHYFREVVLLALVLLARVIPKTETDSFLQI
jgi:hypothetical protein